MDLADLVVRVGYGCRCVSDALQAVVAIRQATARFHAFPVAGDAGYSLAGEPCVASPLGTMGDHAVNPSLAGDQQVRAEQPEVLLDLHAWIWTDNPNGMFAQWNPSLSCQ
jgi:hypothetical protein